MFTAISHRTTTILLVLVLAVGVAIVAMLASGARGGPLDPTGPPASTMHSLDETAPVWDQKLDSTNGSLGLPGGPPAGCNSDRFKCVFPRRVTVLITTYDGVLDRETGLVWQRVPSDFQTSVSFVGAICEQANTAGRHGWRLPTLAELGSLRDESVISGPPLPVGHPFVVAFNNLVNPGVVWSSTDSSAGGAWAESFASGGGGYGFYTTSSLPYWCVRGPTSNR